MLPGNGVYRYNKYHICFPRTSDLTSYNINVNDCNYNLYWNGKD